MPWWEQTAPPPIHPHTHLPHPSPQACANVTYVPAPGEPDRTNTTVAALFSAFEAQVEAQYGARAAPGATAAPIGTTAPGAAMAAAPSVALLDAQAPLEQAASAQP